MKSFEINTHHAYLNTDIILKSIGGDCEVFDQTTGSTYNVDSILNIKLCAGKHILCCAETDQSEEVVIEDAIKLGGSRFKPNASFVSEVTPWIAVTMKDRIYFYNRDTKAEFVEHNLSPTSVKYIGGKANEYFLFGTENDYSVFDAINRQVTYNCNSVIYTNDHLIISEEQGVLTVYDYISDVSLLQVDSQYSIYESNLFYVFDASIIKLDLENNEVAKLKSKFRFGEYLKEYVFSGKYALEFRANYGKKVHYKLIDLFIDQEITIYMDCFVTSFCGIELNLAKEVYGAFEYVANNAYKDFTEVSKEQLKAYYISSSLSLSYYEILNLQEEGGKSNMEVRFVTRYADRYCNSYKYFKFNNINTYVDYSSAIEIKASENKVEDKQVPFRIDSNKGELVSYSDCRNMYISFKDGRLYETNIRDNSCNIILDGVFDAKKYLNAYFSSDGSRIVALNSDKTTDLLGFEDFSESKFDIANSTVYFAGDYGVNGYKPELDITISDGRKPVWRDPITLDIVSDEDRSKCVFRSPNGNYTAENNMKLIYRNTLSGLDITTDEYNALCQKYNWDCNATEEDKKPKIELRERFAANYPDYEELLDIKSENYTSKFIGQLYYVIYRRKGDHTHYRILIGEDVWFLNYVSFSYDSRYLALGAKTATNSGIYKVYDIQNKKFIIETDLKSRYNAVWITIFSKTGDAAYYTSVPDSYFIKASSLSSTNEPIKITGKSLLCFSPSGRYIAFSNQGYIAYNCGKNNNWGHQPSGNIYIHNTENVSVNAEHYNDLGDSVKGVSVRAGNVASAAFSTDEKRFLVVGDDGVVVVRNLKSTKLPNTEIDDTDDLPF